MPELLDAPAPSVPPVHLPPLPLPVVPSHFVGRTRELAELQGVLSGTRLLTLTGAGGSGKTRLAGELAANEQGVYDVLAWADLAPLENDAGLIPQLLRALRTPERMDLTPLDALLAAIGSARTLLVLDNCEHLIDGCAALADALLRGCSTLTILATSREALSVAGETAWLVPSLRQAEAVRLFVERANAVHPAFRDTPESDAAVLEICRRLDGIPLAIELAAARVRALSPAQIVARLDDAFRLLGSGHRTALPRQRTLRGTMEWSHQLLSPREQVLFRRLAVFAGSFSLDAVEVIAAEGPLAAEDILDGIAALVDKSLVVMETDQGAARYHLLQIVRQYAAERMAEAGEEEGLRRRHATYFADLMERSAPILFGGESERGLVNRLSVDADNFRAVYTWSLGDPARRDCGIRLAQSMFWYWYGCGRMNEACAAYDAVLAVLPADIDPLGRGRILLGRGRILLGRGLVALGQGEEIAAREYLGEAADLLERHGGTHDECMTARVKHAASWVLGCDYAEARDRLRALEGQVEQVSNGMVHVFRYFWMAWAAIELGEYDEARLALNHHRMFGVTRNHETAMAHSSLMRGRLAGHCGQFDEARQHFRDAISRYRTMGEAWGMSLSFGGVADLISRRGDHPAAVRLQAGLDTMRDRYGNGAPRTEMPTRERILCEARAALGARFQACYDSGREITREGLVEYALLQSGEDAVTARMIAVTGEHSAVRIPAVRPPASRLRVQALGPLQVEIGARTISASAWGSARPRELLVYLLLHPEGVTKEQVGLAFWPEASASQLRNSFHVTLHRLRKVLDVQGAVVLEGERYRIAPELIGEFDAAHFLEEITRARRALRQGNASAAADLEAALQRYRGDLLDGEPAGEWHDNHRERLRALYLDGMLDLATAQAAQDRHERAAETCRQLLARDDLHEGAVRLLMTALAHLGERSQALRSYQRFAERLRKELGAVPAPETTALAETLRG